MGASDNYPGETTQNPVYQPLPTHEQVEEVVVHQPTPPPPHEDNTAELVERMIKRSTSIVYLLISLQTVLCFLQTTSNALFWINEAFAIIGIIGLSKRSVACLALHFTYSFILYFFSTVAVFMNLATFDFSFVVFAVVFIFMMFSLQHEALLFRLYRASRAATILPVVAPVLTRSTPEPVIGTVPTSSYVQEVPAPQQQQQQEYPLAAAPMMNYPQYQYQHTMMPMSMPMPYGMPQYTPMPYPMPYPYSSLPVVCAPPSPKDQQHQ